VFAINSEQMKGKEDMKVYYAEPGRKIIFLNIYFLDITAV